MGVLDQISEAVTRFIPTKSSKPSMSGGIGSGHGMGAFEDDVSITSDYIHPFVVIYQCISRTVRPDALPAPGNFTTAAYFFT